MLAAFLVTRKAHRLGRKVERISQAVLDRLASYDWPGNVRELENVLERAIILCTGHSLRLEDISLGSTSPVRGAERRDSAFAPGHAAPDHTLQAHERAYIVLLL